MAIPTNRIKKYLAHKYARQNAYCRYSNAQLLYKVGDKWVNEEQFNKLHPEYNYLRYGDLGLDNPNLKFIA